MNRVALRLKLHSVSGSVMHHVAILKRVLDTQGIPVKVKRGFCVIPQTKEACAHYWLQTDEGLDLDVAFKVATLKSPELMSFNPVLLETLPEGMTRSDANELLIRDENERLFDLFHTDPRKFWAEAPRDVASFK